MRVMMTVKRGVGAYASEEPRVVVDDKTSTSALASGDGDASAIEEIYDPESVNVALREWTVFTVESEDTPTVGEAIKLINAKDPVLDAFGSVVEPIGVEFRCGEAKCGGCAMLINGVPRLACETFFDDLGPEVKVEPLSKFPLVHDLIVDRRFVMSAVRDMNVALPDDASFGNGWKLRMDANRCMSCGCCLEVCPNYKENGRFVGALGALAAYGKLCAKTADKDSLRKTKKAYKKLFLSGCDKSLACVKVCPAHLPLSRIFAHANGKALL